MRLVLIAVLAAVATSRAQTPVAAGDLANMAQKFTPEADEKSFPCTVEPIPPVFTFRSRFNAGYGFWVPAIPTSEPHDWTVWISITPDGEDQDTTYLTDRVRLPPGEGGGAYWLGEGDYSVKWMLSDGTGRVCRQEWQIHAFLRASERKEKVQMASNTVAALSQSRQPGTGDPKIWGRHRLTVLLDAAPVSPLNSLLSSSDRRALVQTLVELVGRMPARSVRVVVFSLELQKEIFRKDGFTLQHLGEVARAIYSFQLGPVDYRILQNRLGHVALIENLVNREMHEAEPSDTVVFAGPSIRYHDKVRTEALDKMRGISQHYFYVYLHYWRDPPLSANTGMAADVGGRPENPGGGRGGTANRQEGSATSTPVPLPTPRPVVFSPFPPGNASSRGRGLPDTISSAVGKLNGRVIEVNMPSELGKAVAEVERRIHAGK